MILPGRNLAPYDWGGASHHTPKHGAMVLTMRPGARPMIDPSYKCHAPTNPSVRRLTTAKLGAFGIVSANRDLTYVFSRCHYSRSLKCCLHRIEVSVMEL